MSMYLVCSEHGRIFEQPGASWAATPDWTAMVPARADVSAPRGDDPVACPFCGRDLQPAAA